MKVYAVSDLHVDHKDNLRWLHSLTPDDYGNDILLVAGDIADDLELLKESFDQEKLIRNFFYPFIQKKLDKNKDGKISGADFKMMKKGGKVKKMRGGGQVCRGGGAAVSGTKFSGVR